MAIGVFRSILAAAVTAGVLTGAHADWLQFRGPGGLGVAAPAGGYATSLDPEKSIAWSIDLPGEGLSSPIVIGDRVVVTSSSGPAQETLHVICVDAGSGEIVWDREFRATGRTMHHEKTSVAAPTPASDGSRIFALFSSNDLICLDVGGNLLWLRGLTLDYPNASNSLGLATSPVVVGDTLVVQIENDSESFAAGLDTSNGANRWKIDRPRRASWTSPVIIERPGDSAPVVALQGSGGIDLLEPHSGKTVWSSGGGAATIPSSAGAPGLLVAPINGLAAFRVSEGGVVEQLWQEGSLRPGTASPIVTGGRAYVINSAGVLNAADLETGERLWRIRLEGPFSGSPVIAGDHLYVAAERDGKFQIADLRGEEGMVTGSIDLGDRVQSTPALSDGAIFIRSDHRLFKIVAAAK